MLLNQIQKNRTEAVIHYLGSIKKLKNPESVVLLNSEKSIYSHTNTRGNTIYIRVFNSFNSFDTLYTKCNSDDVTYFSCRGFWLLISNTNEAIAE